MAIGFSLSALTSYLSIHYFLKWIERTGMTPYVAYLLALGAGLLIVGLYRG